MDSGTMQNADPLRRIQKLSKLWNGKTMLIYPKDREKCPDFLVYYFKLSKVTTQCSGLRDLLTQKCTPH
jgi:hypothetical protein